RRARRRPSALLHPHEMAHGVDHAPELPRVLALDAVADPAQAEGAQRVDLPAVRAVARPRLDNAHLAHDAVSVGAGGSAADTPAPAITPVPGEAGLSRTRPEPNTPSTRWVMVEPCFGTLNRFFLARSTPF